MLNFILSGVGGGKTTYIMNKINELSLKGDEKLTLIVPEQHVFTCQKNMLKALGAEKAASCQVLSFTALGEALTEKANFKNKIRLTDSAAAVLMSMALNDVKEELTIYKNRTDSKIYIKSFLSLSTEFKQSGITPEKIREAIKNKTGNNLLRSKLSDIALILEAFDLRVSNSRFNPDDLLTELSGSAALTAYLNGKTLFIDAFRGFTNQEYNIIEKMLVCCKDVYISLCADGLSDSPKAYDLFAKTYDTANKIKSLAKKNNIKIGETIYPNINKTKPQDLLFVEENLFGDSNIVFDGDASNVTLVSADSIYNECAYVSAAVKALVRDFDYRYRDIAIIARNMDTYECTLKSALKKNGIHIYEDYRKNADLSPVINIVSAGVAAASGFDNDTVMRYLKTGLTGISTEDISLVENYCYLWRINGTGAWTKEWKNSPDGFGEIIEENRESVENRLLHLNETREKIVAPILVLKESLAGGVEGEKAAVALWKFIEDINLNENIKALAKQLKEEDKEKNKGVILELERMWNLLIDIINELATLLPGEKITAKKLSNVIELLLSVQTVGNIPQRLDEVTIGSADRIRLNSPKITFIIGANEGVFPPNVSSSSFLSPRDRKAMEDDLNIPLSPTGEWLLADEKLIAYNSVCCAEEKLYVSYTASGADGGAAEPCDFFIRLKAMLPGCNFHIAEEMTEKDELFYSQDKATAFEQLAKSKDETISATLKKYFDGVEEYKGKLNALERVKGLNEFRIENKEIAKQLFGEIMKISPSKTENYYKCPFMYFCNYGIKARPRERADLDARQIGTAIHYLLENLFRYYGRDKLIAMTNNELKTTIGEILNKYYVENLNAPEDEKFKYIYSRLEDTAFAISKRIIKEFEQCSFFPDKFELKIGYNGEVKPYIPEGSNGSVQIIGSVDRVDVAKLNGTTYLRVIDYKSGKKDFNLVDAVNGFNLQMLIYLFALWKNGAPLYGKNIMPAGILYFRANNPIVNADEKDTLDKIEKKRRKEEKSSGIILDDETVVRLMEKEGQGYLIPASIEGDEVIGDKINFTALVKLRRIMDKLIVNMANSLREGKINALPCCKEGEKAPCAYCNYTSVCGYEEGKECKSYSKMKNEKVIEEIENGGEING